MTDTPTSPAPFDAAWMAAVFYEELCHKLGMQMGPTPRPILLRLARKFAQSAHDAGAEEMRKRAVSVATFAAEEWGDKCDALSDAGWRIGYRRYAMMSGAADNVANRIRSLPLTPKPNPNPKEQPCD